MQVKLILLNQHFKVERLHELCSHLTFDSFIKLPEVLSKSNGYLPWEWNKWDEFEIDWLILTACQLVSDYSFQEFRKTVCIVSSSSSCRTASTDIPDPLSPLLPIIFIASGRSSGLHPVSAHSCCMYVRDGRPTFAWPYARVRRNSSLKSSSLLLQQCPGCLVCLAWIVFEMGGRWPYSWCLVVCCRQDLFNIARNILV